MPTDDLSPPADRKTPLGEVVDTEKCLICALREADRAVAAGRTVENAEIMEMLEAWIAEAG